MSEVTLVTIEKAAKNLAAKRERVEAISQVIQENIKAIHKEYMPRLRKAVEEATEADLDLRGLVVSGKALFDRPRTRVFYDIKVGFQKGKGGIHFDEADKVVKLIRKHYSADEALALLHITEKPDKDALAKLSVTELKKIGCDVLHAQDYLVVKPVDDAVEKLVSSMLAAATDEAIKENAA